MGFLKFSVSCLLNVCVISSLLSSNLCVFFKIKSSLMIPHHVLINSYSCFFYQILLMFLWILFIFYHIHLCFYQIIHVYSNVSSYLFLILFMLSNHPHDFIKSYSFLSNLTRFYQILLIFFIKVSWCVPHSIQFIIQFILELSSNCPLIELGSWGHSERCLGVSFQEGAGHLGSSAFHHDTGAGWLVDAEVSWKHKGNQLLKRASNVLPQRNPIYWTSHMYNTTNYQALT